MRENEREFFFIHSFICLFTGLENNNEKDQNFEDLSSIENHLLSLSLDWALTYNGSFFIFFKFITKLKLIN